MVSLRWSREELQACVEAYVDLWMAEQNGKPRIKSDVIKSLCDGPLKARTKGSVEYRFGNISAVMASAGCPFVSGYVPAPNVGPSNSKVIRDMLEVAGLIQ